jgi:hypothetical protein
LGLLLRTSSASPSIAPARKVNGEAAGESATEARKAGRAGTVAEGEGGEGRRLDPDGEGGDRIRVVSGQEGGGG